MFACQWLITEKYQSSKNDPSIISPCTCISDKVNGRQYEAINRLMMMNIFI
jgi:hypothetical protein